MTDLYVCVVAHEKRADMAIKLAHEVEADEVFMDDGFRGEWRNHEYAWKAAARSGKTHAVILQDDAIPVDGFREHALRAATERPNSFISLYTGTHRPRKEQVLHAVKVAQDQDASWLSADTLMWGVGVLVPCERIPDILAKSKESKLPYDQRLGYVFEQWKEPVYYTWPSLVDHADEPTVIPGRPSRQGVRVAHVVGVPNWTDRTVHIERLSANMVASTKDSRVAKASG